MIDVYICAFHIHNPPQCLPSSLSSLYFIYYQQFLHFLLALLCPTSSVFSTLGKQARLPQIKAGMLITMFADMKAQAK